MYPAGDPIIQTLKFLMDQDLHNLESGLTENDTLNHLSL